MTELPEFNQTLGSKGVHIIDPFTGTGTFITRLLQSGLISQDELPYKYKQELHANEIVLLAYYIAAINIEATYHSLIGGKYVPFEGICLTDTFQMYEKDDLVDALIVDNSARRKRQKKLDIRVIVGNPPYSIGQASQNDNNSNITYPNLDRRISESYAELSSATNLQHVLFVFCRLPRLHAGAQYTHAHRQLRSLSAIVFLPIYFTLALPPLLFYHVKFSVYPVYQFRWTDLKHVVLPVAQWLLLLGHVFH